MKSRNLLAVLAPLGAIAFSFAFISVILIAKGSNPIEVVK